MFYSYAKVNLFLKIVGKITYDNQEYHSLLSRFMLIPHLFDTLEVSQSDDFQICGDFDCPKEQNTLYKAYQAILPYVNQEQKHFLNHLKIEVEKKIPSGGGLGGGSSNAAAFLCWVNETLDLKITPAILNQIALKVGSDVPFFVSKAKIANVRGRGEIIEVCEDLPFEVEIITPKIHCNTAEVYRHYASKFYLASINQEKITQHWANLNNVKILQNTPYENNDLLPAVLDLYPKLQEFADLGLFLSGSGSCFFKPKKLEKSKEAQ